VKRNLELTLLLFFLWALPAFIYGYQTDSLWVNNVGAKSFPQSSKIFNVKEFGAKNDSITINTNAIQKAIDSCYKSGGGIVIFEPGIYLSGSIFLKKGVNLRIDKGVELRGSDNLDDYPEIDTRVAGIEMKWPAALINILEQENVAVSGEGIVNGNGKKFWDKYWSMRAEYEPKGLRWIVDYDCKRPRTLLVAESQNITITGITMQQAGFWTIHILYSQYITVDGITIKNNIGGKGPSTDGVDIDSSSYILVKNCDIDCNDDNFCLKSGRDADGLRVNRPTEYILITDCISRRGGGLITLGSETSGSIRNIIAKNLKAKGTGAGIRLKSALTRGGTLENIDIYNVEMDSVANAIDITMNWNPTYSYSELPKGYNIEEVPYHWKVMLQKVEPSRGLPKFQNVNISQVKVVRAKNAIIASGLKTSMLKNFTFKDIHIESFKQGKISYASGWKFDNVVIKSPEGNKLRVVESTDMKL
jgi:polygalacturonase